MGRMGDRHARIYRQISDAQLAAVVDSDHDRAASLAGELGCGVFATVEDLLKSHPDPAALSETSQCPQ